MNDIGQEIAEEAHAAGLRPDQMSRWVRGKMFTEMSRLPATGIYRGVLQERHLSVGTTWKPNDLTDMLYLSTAAGYADIVIAERHMTSVIGNAQRRLKRDLTIYSSLQAALPAVRAVSSAS